MLFCPFLEAREAFIKQFSLLEASTGRLLAQLHGITSALDCSLNTTETNDRNESRVDGGSSAAVCQTFAQTVSVIRGSQRRLQQATLDLDNMVVPDVTTAWFPSQHEANLLKVKTKDVRIRCTSIKSPLNLYLYLVPCVYFRLVHATHCFLFLLTAIIK